MKWRIFLKIAAVVYFFAFLTEVHGQITIGIFSNVKRREELFNLAQAKGVNLYFFNHTSKFDWENRQVKRVTVFKDGRWENKKTAPLPDAVYDYSFYAPNPSSSKKEREISIKRFEVVAAIKADLKAHGIPFYMKQNAYFLVKNKRQFSRFARAEGISHPHTVSVSKENLSSMLSEHPIVYLKPKTGYQGYGIIVFTKINENSVHIFYRMKDTSSDRMLPLEINHVPISQAYDYFLKIKSSIQINSGDYLIQEGISYLRFKDKQTHFRTMTQRGKDGQLYFVECIGKIGGNVSEGGKAFRTEKLLRYFANERRSFDFMMKSIKEESLKTHLMVEKASQSLVAELGTDIVLDENGKAVVIETNNKPGLLYFDRIADIKNRSEAHKIKAKEAAIRRENHILDYGIFLALSKNNKDIMEKSSY